MSDGGDGTSVVAAGSGPLVGTAPENLEREQKTPIQAPPGAPSGHRRLGGTGGSFRIAALHAVPKARGGARTAGLSGAGFGEQMAAGAFGQQLADGRRPVSAGLSRDHQ